MKHIAPLALATCALAFSFVLATPAGADSRHDRQAGHRQHDRQNDRQRDRRRVADRHRSDDRYRHNERRGYNDRYERRQPRRQSLLDLPLRLHERHVRALERFVDRHVYFAPHRHRHVVYTVPVVIDGHRVYERGEYCDGDLFGPRFQVRLDF